MSSLNYNYSTMQEQIIPNINNAIDKINSITYIGNNTYIPNDFYYKYTLRELFNDFSDIRRSLDQEIDFINKSNKRIEEELQSIEEQLRAISNVEIKRNNSYIK